LKKQSYYGIHGLRHEEMDLFSKSKISLFAKQVSLGY